MAFYVFFTIFLLKQIDEQWMESRIYWILCGSSVSFMENEVLREKGPLFGRRTSKDPDRIRRLLNISINDLLVHDGDEEVTVCLCSAGTALNAGLIEPLYGIPYNL